MQRRDGSPPDKGDRMWPALLVSALLLILLGVALARSLYS